MNDPNQLPSGQNFNQTPDQAQPAPAASPLDALITNQPQPATTPAPFSPQSTTPPNPPAPPITPQAAPPSVTSEPQALPPQERAQLEDQAKVMVKELDQMQQQLGGNNKKGGGAGKILKAGLAALSLFVVGGGILVGVQLLNTQQSANNQSQADTYCAICSPSGACECINGQQNGMKCNPAPAECSELGYTWQPDASCQVGASCGGGGGTDPGTVNLFTANGCILATHTGGPAVDVNKGCYICSGPANDGCNDQSADFVSSCDSGQPVTVYPGETGKQIICSPGLNVCQNFQIDAWGGGDSDAIVGEHPTQGQACFPTPTPAPTTPPELVCTGLALNPASPKLGQNVTLTCSGTPANSFNRAEFQKTINNGSFTDITGASGFSVTTLIDQAGNYTFRCRMCTAQNTCTNWQTVGGN
jgi:hypothetical protein